MSALRLRIFLSVFFFPLVLYGQAELDEYVKFGLENNLALKQKLSGYQKSIEALREARGLFYPNLSLNARYTRAEGGRSIDFPVGDLLNPVYATLNALTGQQLFPMVDNQEILFVRPSEHDTKFRLTQPVFNSDIYYNSRIKQELTVFEDADVNQYRRELVAEIKKAYWDVTSASGVLKMLTETRKLLEENVRVSTKLIENDKVTRDYLYRSQAELSKFDQELQNASKNMKTASAYFNFLLNKPLTDSIIIREPEVFPTLSLLTADYSKSALDNREELKKLSNYSKISDYQIKMNQAGSLPDIFILVDYGFQGLNYRINTNQEYVQASAILTWDLFSGFRNRAKLKQSVLDKEILDRKIEEARKQIELQVINALNELLAAEKGIDAAESRVRNSREGFRLIVRKYEEGQANLLEFIDARTTLTQAEENLILSRCRYLSCFAELEKVTAINKYQ